MSFAAWNLAFLKLIQYINIYLLQEHVPMFDYFLEMCSQLSNLLRLLLYCARSSFSEWEAEKHLKSWRTLPAFVPVVPGSFTECVSVNIFEANLNNVIIIIKNQKNFCLRLNQRGFFPGLAENTKPQILPLRNLIYFCQQVLVTNARC